MFSGIFLDSGNIREYCAAWNYCLIHNYLSCVLPTQVRYSVMGLQMKSNLLSVGVLSVNGLYSQIYDEIYCDQNKYNEILVEFGDSDKYKVISI